MFTSLPTLTIVQGNETTISGDFFSHIQVEYGDICCGRRSYEIKMPW